MVNIVPKVFPDRPESDDDYTEILTVYESGTFVVPEDGWFKVVVTGMGYDGSESDDSRLPSSGHIITGSYRSGSGGAAGGAAISIFAFNKGEEVPYTILNGNATLLEMNAVRTTASGGNIQNYNGNPGGPGIYDSISAKKEHFKSTIPGGYAGTGPSSYNPAGGTGGSVYGGTWNEEDEHFAGVYKGTPGKATPNFIKFFRGNTNLSLDQINAQNITGLMLEMSQLAQEQTSMLINADVSH